jgi:sugar/nucleoside kinase (ribokinase family)
VKRFRHLGFALCLAFALLAGERGALLHELGHGLQRMHAPQKDGAPAGDTCDKCFAFSQLSGPAPGACVALAIAVATAALGSFVAIPAPSRTVVATRSRAPPAIS